MAENQATLLTETSDDESQDRAGSAGGEQGKALMQSVPPGVVTA
jgi:hypothetical protein